MRGRLLHAAGFILVAGRRSPGHSFLRLAVALLTARSPGPAAVVRRHYASSQTRAPTSTLSHASADAPTHPLCRSSTCFQRKHWSICAHHPVILADGMQAFGGARSFFPTPRLSFLVLPARQCSRLASLAAELMACSSSILDNAIQPLRAGQDSSFFLFLSLAPARPRRSTASNLLACRRFILHLSSPAVRPARHACPFLTSCWHTIGIAPSQTLTIRLQSTSDPEQPHLHGNPHLSLSSSLRDLCFPFHRTIQHNYTCLTRIAFPQRLHSGCSRSFI